MTISSVHFTPDIEEETKEVKAIVVKLSIFRRLVNFTKSLFKWRKRV